MQRRRRRSYNLLSSLYNTELIADQISGFKTYIKKKKKLKRILIL